MSTQPTDDEIVALADATRTAEGGANGYILPISFARAVLAKWGTPATGGEPVAWRYQDARGNYRYRGYVPRFDKDYALLKPIPLYTTPRPVREPLSTIDLMRVMMKADEESQDTRGTPNWAAHIGKAVQNAVLGITGGQHG